MIRNYSETRFGRISYLIRDGKIPLILMHGFGGTGNTFLRIEPYLNENFKVIFPDLLGHGHSDKPDIDYTIHQQALAINDMIKSLNLDKIIIGGNSYGGWIALDYALNINEPEALILIDSAGTNRTFAEDGMVNEVVDEIMKVRNYKNRDALIKIAENNGRPSEKINLNDLKRLSCKTIIIWGKNDNTIPISKGYEYKNYIRNSEMHVLDSGHTPQISNPEEVSSIINKIIE
ncbi:alpha/beta fold hydrolase [Picrophilus oshimae]|uniref:Pimeloyl-ACP methyl ester carboxylesterase n=1 Tax=Picrophilus torridus (strain ATCC 700027 / DSM 9790 / JCM 10055 / NBRC 100828 / KAW 2/3) TaxID=1122961 RepID=A0A8G2FXN5_PICTO|nr:alpha/beta hydrolase [Picrophilus oshimae]SMD31351.1 Pimeloyl-ACP methyl ester carboxylesterase [Picrophilus oshimae DSM 9789]